MTTLKRLLPLLTMAILLMLGACTISVSPQSNETATITPMPFFSATIPPTFTPRPSSTALPPTAIPTIAPVTGSVTTQINVRSKPDQNSDSLGTLKNGDQVQIIGKDVSGAWWQIIYASSTDGKGWVTSAYVNVQGNGSSIPLIDQTGAIIPTSNPIINTIAPTNAPFTATSPVKTASVQSKINVRSGPGSNYNSLGLLNPGDTVTLTGRNETSAWLQIIYPGGPDDRGWVSAAYVQAASVEGLPYFNNLGTPIGNIPTLAVNPATPTPTLVPAPQDGDSSTAPAFSLTFSPAGSRLFSFSDAVSSPEGDSEDWLAIQIDGASGQTKTILISLSCTGNGSAQAILQKSGSAFANSGAIECGAAGQSFTLNTQETYLLQIKAVGAASLQFTSYTISIQAQ